MMSFDEKLAKLRRGIEIPAPNRERRKLDFYVVQESALECMTRSEFQMKDKSAYNWALARGVMDEVCEHMGAKQTPGVKHARS